MKSFESIKICRCKKCGNQVIMIQDGGAPMTCCGEVMQVLDAHAQDGAKEKHVPVVERDGDLIKVCVGDVEHPMLEEHFIQWIMLQTDKGVSFKALNPGEAPKAEFLLHGEKPVAVFEFCNLHGLWKVDL